MRTCSGIILSVTGIIICRHKRTSFVRVDHKVVVKTGASMLIIIYIRNLFYIIFLI